MYKTPVIIGKYRPDRANRTLTHSGGVLLHPEGYYTGWDMAVVLELQPGIKATLAQ